MWGLGMNGLPKEMSDYLNRMLLEEQEDREAFAAELEGFSEADLMAFVPDVYQKSIYKIDYGKLKEKGIMLISFDIDDTISDSIWNKMRGALPGVKVTMPKDAKNLFRAKLLEYGLWRKHHKEIKGDQYYQLGELPKYQTKQAPFPSAQKNDVEAAAADLIQQVAADQDKTYTLEELQQISIRITRAQA